MEGMIQCMSDELMEGVYINMIDLTISFAAIDKFSHVGDQIM